MTIGEKITRHRMEKGWTGREMARRLATLGLSIKTPESRVPRWEDGTSKPSVEQARLIADLFEIPLDYLTDDAQTEPPPRDLGQLQRRIEDLVRALGPEEALRRLLDNKGEPAERVGRLVPKPIRDDVAGDTVKSFESGQG